MNYDEQKYYDALAREAARQVREAIENLRSEAEEFDAAHAQIAELERLYRLPS